MEGETARLLIKRENESFLKRSVRSAETWRKALQETPLGVHSNYRFTAPYPVYMRRGSGSRIVDVDGNEYIDFNMGYGALVSGHANPILVEALKNTLDESHMLGFETELGIAAAAVVNKRFSTERVRFSNTGTEATMHALRMARGFTGREKVLKFEGCYHGSNTDLLFSVKPKSDEAGSMEAPLPVPAGPGIPSGMKGHILIAPFNNIDAVSSIMQAHQDEIAAVILEPYPMNMGVVIPKPDFIRGLRKLCDRTGSLLIFDEVKTCGKFYGGAEEALGVKPDLKILGKAIGGGIPVSAIAGRKEIFENVGPGRISHAGTFNSNSLAMQALNVALEKILTRESVRRAQQHSIELASAYTDILSDRRIEAHVPVAGLSGAISFAKKQPENWREFLMVDTGKWNYYYSAMTNRGVIPAAPGPDEQWTVSVMHTEEDVVKSVESFKEIATALEYSFDGIEIQESV
ncbi:MAG: aspartate aminotransferase family protein [Methanomassiliicoccales archaeon]